jgi:hypothetical protein
MLPVARSGPAALPPHYQAGDCIVANSSDQSDQDAMPADTFEKLYMPTEEDK